MQDALPLGHAHAPVSRPGGLRRAWRGTLAFLERPNVSTPVNEIHRSDFDQLLRSTFD